jgi:hypothetical protein
LTTLFPDRAKEEYERRQREGKRSQQEHQSISGFGKSTFRHPDRMTRFTFGVFTFTVVLAVAALIQAWAFIQSERAFLVLTGMQVTGGFEGGKPLITSLTFTNSGRSPATEATVYYTSDIKLLPTPQYSRNKRSVPPVASGANLTMNFGPKTPLNEDEGQAIKTGKLPFYVFGYISFKDEFTLYGARQTGFCGAFDFQTNSFVTCDQNGYIYIR